MKHILEFSDEVIAADGASNLCFQKNIKLNKIVGDFDSIDDHTK